MRTLIVATTLACQGFKVKSGEHLWIADDPLDFAEGIVALGEGDPGQQLTMLDQARSQE